MFAANASRIAAKLQMPAVQSSRHMSVVSGPPQVKVSVVEKFVHGFAIFTGIMAIPAWVLVNIKNYRARE